MWDQVQTRCSAVPGVPCHFHSKYFSGQGGLCLIFLGHFCLPLLLFKFYLHPSLPPFMDSSLLSPGFPCLSLSSAGITSYTREYSSPPGTGQVIQWVELWWILSKHHKSRKGPFQAVLSHTWLDKLADIHHVFFLGSGESSNLIPSGSWSLSREKAAEQATGSKQ